MLRQPHLAPALCYHIGRLCIFRVSVARAALYAHSGERKGRLGREDEEEEEDAGTVVRPPRRFRHFANLPLSSVFASHCRSAGSPCNQNRTDRRRDRRRILAAAARYASSLHFRLSQLLFAKAGRLSSFAGHLSSCALCWCVFLCFQFPLGPLPVHWSTLEDPARRAIGEVRFIVSSSLLCHRGFVTDCEGVSTQKTDVDVSVGSAFCGCSVIIGPERSDQGVLL